jgi:hypothetical protein
MEKAKEELELIEKWGLVKTVVKEKCKINDVDFLIAYFEEDQPEGMSITASSELKGNNFRDIVYSLLYNLSKSVKDFMASLENIKDNSSLGILIDINATDKTRLNYAKIISECPKKYIETVINFWSLWLMDNKDEIIKDIKEIRDNE